MYYACSYTPKGEILNWYSVSKLRPLLDKHLVSHTSDAGIALAPAEFYGIVAQFPIETTKHDSSWALQNLRVSRIFPNNMVEVGFAR